MLASMKYALKDFSLGLECILRDPEMHSVTVWCGKLSWDMKERIRITRRGKNELIITMGRPNYAEREMLKLCKKARTNPRKFLFKYYGKKKKKR